MALAYLPFMNAGRTKGPRSIVVSQHLGAWTSFKGPLSSARVALLQERVVQEHPELIRNLVVALRQARDFAPRWMSEEGLKTWEKERAKLGGREPLPTSSPTRRSAS